MVSPSTPFDFPADFREQRARRERGRLRLLSLPGRRWDHRWGWDPEHTAADAAVDFEALWSGHPFLAPSYSEPPVKSEPGACKPLGSWLQGAKSLLIPHSPLWPPGSPHTQQPCIPKALCPGEACASRAMLREGSGAGVARAGLCFSLQPCSRPRRCPPCRVPHRSRMDPIHLCRCLGSGTREGATGVRQPCFAVVNAAAREGECVQARGLAKVSAWSGGPAGGSVEKQVPSGGWKPAKCLLTLPSLPESCRCLGSQA